MKIVAALASTLLLLASSAGIAQAPTAGSGIVCLNARNIQRTEALDDRTILFHMRDGKVWRNRLRQICPMLKTSGFAQILHNDQVCSNQQFIHVLQTGDNCSLGEFTPVETPR